MSAAHKDTPRVGWQQQSGQFLQAPSHGSGLHYPESFLVNVSTGYSNTSCKLKHSCFTSSWLLIHIVNKPHATDSKADMHTSQTWSPETRKGKHWVTLTQGLTARDVQITTTAQLSGGTHSRASPVLSQILHLTVSILNKSFSLLAAGGWIYSS